MNSIKKNNIAILIMKRMEAWSYFGIILWLYYFNLSSVRS